MGGNDASVLQKLFFRKNKTPNAMDVSKDRFDLKGKNAERLVHELALKTFLTDWCYLNPSLPNKKELCDLLVIYDQVAIIWQIKDLKLDSNGRYKKSEVERNLRQLTGARRQLFDLKTPIELENPRHSKDIFDPSEITEIYLISVLLGEGELPFRFVDTIKDYTVHVFNRDFTQIVLTELNTIADFTAYLKTKEAVLQRTQQLTIFGGEEELLAFYLLNSRSFNRFGQATHIVIEEGSWQHLQDDPRYRAKRKKDEISYGWDDIINRAHEGGGEYEKVAGELARPTRFYRRFYAKAFYDAHVIAHNDNIANAYRRVMPSDSMTYCFLFCDEKESNETRKAMLHATCFVARGKFRQNTKVLGIATEKHFAPSCSYDFCLLDYPEWTDECQVLMEQIQSEFDILVDPMVTEVEEKEYPG